MMANAGYPPINDQAKRVTEHADRQLDAFEAAYRRKPRMLGTRMRN